MKVEIQSGMRDRKMTNYTDTGSSGISSSDTHRSSVRYEPVSDQTFSPPSPMSHASRLKSNQNHSTSSHSRVESDSDVDEIENDMIDHEQRPLNSTRRASSPSLDLRLQQSRRGSSYMTRTSSGNVYVAKSSSTSNDPRHHVAMPRMGTGLVQGSGACHTSNHMAQSSNLYNQQTPTSAVTSRITSSIPSDTDKFFPVVTTTLKPAYEVDEPGLWSYSRGNEAERPQYGGYNSGIPPASHSSINPGVSPGVSGTNSAARFLNKRPSFSTRHHFESNLHRRESRQYEGTFNKFKSGCWKKCSWKCAAISFIFISIVFLAIIAFFLVQALSSSPEVISLDNNILECSAISDTGKPTTHPERGSPVELQLKQKTSIIVPQRSFSWMQVYVEEPRHIKFNCNVSPNAEMAIYGRKGLRPTHTKFDFFEKVDGTALPSARSVTSHISIISMTNTQNTSRKRRSIPSTPSVNIGFLEYLEAGTWHLAVFNDGTQDQELEITTSVSESLSQCPGSCNNNGDCVKGVCKCFPGFQGKDCSQVSCSVTCRGNGAYAHGKCVCFSGWKGVDCGTPSNECIFPDCGGHGKCSADGECVCEQGYKGESCQEVDCLDPTCSSHGICVQGQCRCDRGWKGTVCSQEDTVCVSNCGGHGTFDDLIKKCICEPGWGGTDCSTALCRPACDPKHGICMDGVCRCDEGWSGDACDVRQCHSLCEEHGSCTGGICICDLGWNGDLCTFSGCPNSCSDNGHCIRDADGDWFCSCRSGWKGAGCDVEVEVHCTDGKDNDLDTLIDCQDPDCCSRPSCSPTSQCRGGLDPTHEVTRSRGRNPISPTASFYDRVKFLISRNGVQINSALSAINPRRASVIRGQVVTRDGSPLVGVQVQIKGQIQYGSTKTRSDGWFDLLVNGGSSLTVSFQRSSFVRASSVVSVSWNDFVILPVTTLRTLREPVNQEENGNICDISRYPPSSASVLISSVRAYTAAGCSEKGSVIPETQAIREAVSLPSSQASMIYLSSRSAGYQSILVLSLIAGEKPANLVQVRIKISVQGTLFEKKFEPLSDLKYVFEWSREDAYGQRVYGNVKALVMVGYLYESCSNVMWKRLSSTLQGHDPSQLDTIGLWSFDIHHMYYPEKGVVHLGNGGEMRLLDQPPMMATVMGNGKSRHPTCERCEGPAYRAKLMSPVALATDAAGNVYVGDHNFIRMIDISGNVSSLYTTRSAPAKYYMAVSPLPGGSLYFSHPTQRQIFKLRSMKLSKHKRVRDLMTNYELVAGSGAACYPLQEDKCGNGGPAISASLSSPKGLTFDKFGRLYFVDGTQIRTIEPDGQTIRSFAGSLLTSGTRPLPCDGSISLDQLELVYPTDLVISPTDGSLFVLDSDIVIWIDVDSRQASLVAGVPAHCARIVAKQPNERDARKVNLISPTSITVSPRDGALYVAETDQKFIHRIRRVNPYNGQIATVAGVESSCDCAVQECNCFSGDGDFARSAFLHNPTAIAASPDGSIYIADQLNLRIRKLVHSLPSLTANNYHVSNPDANQMYVFDKNGRHLATKNVITGTMLYRFNYAATGRLSTITDVNENELRISYSIRGRPHQILLPNGDIAGLEINSGGSLVKLSRVSSSPIASFTYQGDGSGLIRSSVRGTHASSFYVYDVYGRLISTTSSTGAMTTVHAKMNTTCHTVTMTSVATSAGNGDSQMGVGRRDVVITTEPGYLCDIITTVEGAMTTKYKKWTDNSISVRYLDDSELSLETKPHPVLGLTAPFLAKRTIQLPANPLENKIEWKTRKEKESGYPANQVLLGRRMRVNDRNILSLDYSQGMMMEKIYDDHTKFMLRVQYNDRGLPKQWMSKSGSQSPVNVTYDSRGHAVTWQRGADNELIQYDNKGNLHSIRYPDGSVWRYTYGNNIVHLSLSSSSSQYTFTYDANANLASVTVPSGLLYNVKKKIGVGFVRVVISGPDNYFTMIEDSNNKGNPLSLYYPGNKRKVVYRYDAHDHLTEVLHDSTRTRMLRDPRSGELVSVATKDCTMRFHRNGPLVQRHVITSTEDGGLLAVIDYTHDVNLRLNSMEVKVNGTHLPVEHFSYNDVSGKLTTFGSYRIIDISPSVYVIGNEAVTLSKKLDGNGRIVETGVHAYSVPVFSMKVHYNKGGRMSSLTVSLGTFSNDSRMDYTYTKDGRLSTVAEDGIMRWRYSYDKDGKLKRIENGEESSSLRYDKQGRLTSLGDLQYELDQDGFLRQRGNEVFEYDSLGHLVHAYRLDSSYETKYGYDGFGRLATRVDVRRNHVLRYLYADVTKLTTLTHVYNATSGHVTAIRYDVEGHVFAMERSDGMAWSVVCDHAGTPTAVLDRTGFVVKKIKYSPFGQVLMDSDPEIYLPIGFRGGIYDVSTGLVHFNDRKILSPSPVLSISSTKPFNTESSTEESSGKMVRGVDYDSLTGQFTSCGISSLKTTRAPATPFHMYQVTDPLNPSPLYNHMTNTNSWLSALGFKLQNVAPDPQIASRQKDKSSAECQLSHLLSSYMSLQTSTPSVLVPVSEEGDTPTPGGTLFAQGLVIVIDRGSVSTVVVDSATDDVKRLSGIISGSNIVIGEDTDSASAAMSLTLEGKPTLYLVKSVSSLAKDKQTLRLDADRDKILNSAYDDSSSSGPIAVSLHGNEIRAESGYAIVAIIYIRENSDTSAYDADFSTKTQVRQRILDQAKKRAESEAWLREKHKIQSGLRTRWSSREAQEILSRGSLTSYSVVLTWDPDRYPELADSGRNVKFVRKT